MAKRKISAKQRELSRIKRQIRRTEKRGYRYSTHFKESLNNLSWQKLRTITSEKLYAQSEALSESGKIISGTERRAEERKISAKKGVQTKRKINTLGLKNVRELRAYESQQKTLATSMSDKQLEELAERELLAMQAVSKFSQGEIAFQNIEDLINRFPTEASNSLKKGIANAIKNYGEDTVKIAMADSHEQLVQLAQEIVAYIGTNDVETKEIYARAYRAFFDIIEGTIPTEEQLKTIGDVLDSISSENEG